GVISGGPAEKAGMRGGDIIVEFSNKKIDNIHDYVFTLETIRPNEPTKIVVMRNGKREEIDITPEAKE
ncbi:MAG: PDZ domain-containing protein, partial [Bdellovibrionales bacterium]|nr:PDZ domain-containing protein [Bdellovibrionales bacterium]